ncbi:hypothetical protein D3C77_399630 [compost metagenome]
MEKRCLHLDRAGEMQLLELTLKLMLRHPDDVFQIRPDNIHPQNGGCISLVVHDLNRLVIVVHPALQPLKYRSTAAVAAAPDIQ